MAYKEEEADSDHGQCKEALRHHADGYDSLCEHSDGDVSLRIDAGAEDRQILAYFDELMEGAQEGNNDDCLYEERDNGNYNEASYLLTFISTFFLEFLFRELLVQELQDSLLVL